MSEANNPIKVLDELIEEVELEKYFIKTKFMSGFSGFLLAQEILKKIKVVTLKDTGEMLYFDEAEGIWRYNAEAKIQEIVKDIFGKFMRVHFLNETMNAIKTLTYIDRKHFENVPIDLIPVSNGVLNIKTKQLLGFSPNYYFTFKLPVKYDPQAKCPKILRFLSEVMPNERYKETLIELPAYCLKRAQPLQKAFMLVGDGANGKSTYLNLLIRFLGEENVSSVSLQDLETNRFASYSLYRKMANIHPDLLSVSLPSSGKFKALTCDDAIEFEQKFKGRFLGRSYAKLIFSANSIPAVRDDSNAYFRRWVIIPFTCVFTDKPDPNNPNERLADKEILEKITTEEELSGLLNLCLERLDKVLKEGFSCEESVEQTRELYRKHSDPVWAFTTDCLDEDPDSYETKDAVYNAYVKYCKERKYPILDKNVFGRVLRLHVSVYDFRPKGEDGQRLTCWKGIKLLNHTNNDENNEKTSLGNNKIIENNPDIPDTENSHVRDIPDTVRDVFLSSKDDVRDVKDVCHNYYYKTKPIRTRLTELYKSLNSRKVPVDVLKQHFTDEEISKMLENGDIFEPSKDLFVLVNYDEVELS